MKHLELVNTYGPYSIVYMVCQSLCQNLYAKVHHNLEKYIDAEVKNERKTIIEMYQKDLCYTNNQIIICIEK